MTHFKNRTFNKQKLAKITRLLCPEKTAPSIDQIDLAHLQKLGKKLILVDVDNTLIAWHSTELDKPIFDWFEKGKRMGLQFCIISNTNRRERLNYLSKLIQIPVIRGRFKPSRQMFRRAMKRFNAIPEETIMIGDQLFTDILGANRAGIDSIWVRPIATKEFFGTKFSRMAEKLALLYIRPAITSSEE